MNKKFKIGDYDEWDGLDTDDKKFHNYHQAVIAYIEKYILESKVSNKETKNNKNKIKV